ncbi:hypothetical protein ACHWQZ_G005622 [Mnemiopsis leidyi]
MSGRINKPAGKPQTPSPLVKSSAQSKRGLNTRSPVLSPTTYKSPHSAGKSLKLKDSSITSIDVLDSPTGSSLCRSLFDLEKCPCNLSQESWLIDCSKCRQYWHTKCVTLDGLSKKDYNKIVNWLCPFCYTAPVSTADFSNDASCLTCRNTKTLRDANHAFEVSAAAAKIKSVINIGDISGPSDSLLSQENSIRCIESEMKQMNEACQTDIRKLINEVCQLKTELTNLSSTGPDTLHASHHSSESTEQLLATISCKIEALSINESSITAGLNELKQSVASLRSTDPHPTVPSRPPLPPDSNPIFPVHPTRVPRTGCEIPHVPHRQIPVSDTKHEFLEQTEANELKVFFDSCSFKPESGHSVMSFGSPYQYTGSKSSSNVPPIPDILKPLLERINNVQSELYRSLYPDQPFLTPPEINSCLVNKYQGSDSFLPRHADREMTIHPESSIFTISLGQSCDVTFTERESGTESSHPCPDRSLYIMSRRSQEVFDHEIEKGSMPAGTRYSLTFRCISWTHNNSTCLIGDSNTRFLRFGSNKRGTFGEQMPGQKFWAPKLKDIDPVSCMGYSNVVLLCGINDIKESQIQCESDVADCYTLLKQKIKQIKLLSPCTKAVFVCQLLPTKDLTLNRKVNDFNRLIHFDLFPSCKDVEYVEGFRQFVCNRVLAAELSMHLDRHGRFDMLHLNRAGARVLASLIKQSVFLRVHGGVDKRRHTGRVNGRLYSSVVEARLHPSGMVDGCQV